MFRRIMLSCLLLSHCVPLVFSDDFFMKHLAIEDRLRRNPEDGFALIEKDKLYAVIESRSKAFDRSLIEKLYLEPFHLLKIGQRKKAVEGWFRYLEAVRLGIFPAVSSDEELIRMKRFLISETSPAETEFDSVEAETLPSISSQPTKRRVRTRKRKTDQPTVEKDREKSQAESVSEVLSQADKARANGQVEYARKLYAVANAMSGGTPEIDAKLRELEAE